MDNNKGVDFHKKKINLQGENTSNKIEEKLTEKERKQK